MAIAAPAVVELLPEHRQTTALLPHTDESALALLSESPALSTALSLCLHAQVPMVLVCGEASHCLYNDACIPLLGALHPRAFGQPLAAVTAQRLGLAGATDRQQHPEPSAWSCSPVLESGRPLGQLYIAAHPRGQPSQWHGNTLAATTLALPSPTDERSHDSFLLHLEDALQHVSEPRAIVDTSVRLLGEHLRVNRCAFGLAAEDHSVMHVISDYVQDMPSLKGDFPLEAAQGLRDALLENRTWFTTDAMAPGAPDYVVEQYRHSGLRASLAIPLHKHGQLVAAIGVHQRAPRQWASTDIELVRLVVARCWESMQRAKAQRQLAASEARLRRLAARCRRSSSSPIRQASRTISINAGTNTPA